MNQKNLNNQNSQNNHNNQNNQNYNKVIFHVDVNNAYLSWTAVDLLKQGYKDIREIPSIIGGDESKRSGIVLAKSIPAKKLGIKTAEPVFFALKKCKNLEIFPPNFMLYEEKSNELNILFGKYTEIIERYSVDESFLDVTDYLLGRTPLELAQILQKDIFDTFGWTVNIGVSDLKMLAKTASDFKKPNMIHTLFSPQIKEKLWPLDISSLFSVGRKTQAALRKLQIQTIGDLANSDRYTLEKRLGKAGLKIWELANGIDNSVVLSSTENFKSISHSETLVSNISSVQLIKKQILKLTEFLANRLRNEHMLTKTIRLTLVNKDFKHKSKQKSLKNYTDNTQEIYTTAIKILEEIFVKDEIRLIGVALENLTENDFEQINLFDIEKEITEKDTIKHIKKKNCRNIKEQKLDYVLDDINKKYQANIIKRARNIDNKK